MINLSLTQSTDFVGPAPAQDDTLKLLWDDRPYSLVSLFQMLIFHASNFIRLVQDFSTLEQMLKTENLSEKIDSRFRDTAATRLKTINDDLTKMRLEVSHTLVQDKIDYLSRVLSKSDMFSLITSVRDTVSAEIKTCLLLRVDSHRVEFFKNDNLFGDELIKNFPSASYDISEAGKCLALDRSTACVFHLMNTLEVGLKCLAKSIGVKYDYQNWNLILEKIEAKINKAGIKKTKHSRDREQFYSEASALFRNVKDAWRNHVAHGRARYDDKKAEEIFSHTGAFMRHLATRLSEQELAKKTVATPSATSPSPSEKPGLGV